MELHYDSEEQISFDWNVLGTILVDIRNPHDRRVSLIEEELRDWDGVMYSRQSYSTWWWFDKAEMDRFVTYFNLKHGEK
jgi:hypothetical protein